MVMKIPGTPRRMEEFIKAIQASAVSVDAYSSLLASAATELADATPISLGDNIDWDEFRRDCIYSAKSKSKISNDYTIGPNTIRGKSEPQARLTPALCTCCGGRIGRDNYCEYCGTRYW